MADSSRNSHGLSDDRRTLLKFPTDAGFRHRIGRSKVKFPTKADLHVGRAKL